MSSSHQSASHDAASIAGPVQRALTPLTETLESELGEGVVSVVYAGMSFVLKVPPGGGVCDRVSYIADKILADPSNEALVKAVIQNESMLPCPVARTQVPPYCARAVPVFSGVVRCWAGVSRRGERGQESARGRANERERERERVSARASVREKDRERCSECTLCSQCALMRRHLVVFDPCECALKLLLLAFRVRTMPCGCRFQAGWTKCCGQRSWPDTAPASTTIPFQCYAWTYLPTI